MANDSRLPDCEAFVDDPPWYLHTYACTRKGRYEISDGERTARVCGTHRNQWERYRVGGPDAGATLAGFLGVKR